MKTEKLHQGHVSEFYLVIVLLLGGDILGDKLKRFLIKDTTN